MFQPIWVNTTAWWQHDLFRWQITNRRDDNVVRTVCYWSWLRFDLNTIGLLHSYPMAHDVILGIFTGSRIYRISYVCSAKWYINFIYILSMHSKIVHQTTTKNKRLSIWRLRCHWWRRKLWRQSCQIDDLWFSVTDIFLGGIWAKMMEYLFYRIHVLYLYCI